MKIKEIQRLISAVEEEVQFYKQKLEQTKHIVYSSFKSSANQTEELLDANIEKLVELNKVFFYLRDLIKQFNADKIDTKTNKIAELNSQLSFYEVGATIGQPRENSTYGRSDVTHRAGVTSDYEAESRAKVKSLKRKIQSLKDSCAGINASSEIEINQEYLDILKKYSLID